MTSVILPPQEARVSRRYNFLILSPWSADVTFFRPMFSSRPWSLDLVVWILTALDSVRQSLVAAHVLQVYEWMYNLEDELRLIIRARWTSMKVAYLLCRYYPLLFWPVVEWAYVFGVSSKCCRAIPLVHGMFLPLSLFAQAVLCMRAYAFSGRNRLVLIALVSCFGFLVGSHIWLFGIEIPIFEFRSEEMEGIINRLQPPPAVLSCFPDVRVRGLGTRFVTGLVALTLTNLTTMSVVAFYCLRRTSRQTSLGRYFMKQGLYSFIFTVTFNGAAVALYLKGGSQVGGVSLPFIFILPDLLACRVVLQLRRHAMPLSNSQLSRLQSEIVGRALKTDAWRIEDHSDRLPTANFGTHSVPANLSLQPTDQHSRT